MGVALPAWGGRAAALASAVLIFVALLEFGVGRSAPAALLGGRGALAALGARRSALTAYGRARPARDGRGLLGLPVSAQGAVSAALGREDPRYRILSSSGGRWGKEWDLHAANPGQGFAARFSGSGVTLVAHRARFGLSLAGLGRGGALLRSPQLLRSSPVTA